MLNLLIPLTAFKMNLKMKKMS